MPEEIDALRPHLRAARTTERAGRVFHHGDLWGIPVVVVFSRWGKVAAASTATELIVGHGAGRVVFCGIAGGLDPALRIGDVVVARELYFHDLDASPFFPPGEVPLLGVRSLHADGAMSAHLLAAAARFVGDDLRWAAGVEGHGLFERLGLATAKAVRADIASGDQVIAGAAAREHVLQRVPTAACVEMEGAAVAQVCHEHAVPFAVVRTISDTADEHLTRDVLPFFGGLAGVYTVGTLRRWLSADDR